MVTFISRMIMKAADKSLAEGQAKYRAYFGGRKLYEKYRLDVESILIEEGYEDVIVEV